MGLQKGEMNVNKKNVEESEKKAERKKKKERAKP